MRNKKTWDNPDYFEIIKKFYRNQIKKIDRAQSLIKLNAKEWN
jgi:hypothetical protein